MQKKVNTKKIALTGLLLALEIIFSFVSNILPSTGVANINFSLLPICIASIACGPVYGALIGFVNGLFSAFAPATISVFWPINTAATIILCLLKTTLAGFISGLIFNLFKKINKKTTGASIASILVPIINTLVFTILCLIFFKTLIPSTYKNIFFGVLFGLVGWNFLVEVLLSIGLTLPIYKLLLYREY